MPSNVLSIKAALASLRNGVKSRKTNLNNACGLLVFAAIVLLAVSQILDETTTSNFQHADKGGYKLLCLSADSWCGYSKKMSAQEKEIKAALKKVGVSLELVSDKKDKAKFDKLKKKYKELKGFPHCVLLKDGKPVKHLPGFRPAAALAEAVKSSM